MILEFYEENYRKKKLKFVWEEVCETIQFHFLKRLIYTNYKLAQLFSR